MLRTSLVSGFCSSALLFAALGAGSAASGEVPQRGPVLKPLVRFPDVPRGGDFVVTVGAERPVHIRYEPELDPASFRATLNGKDVSKLFSPERPYPNDAVELPLSPGRNTLRIEVNSRQAQADPKSVLLPQEHIVNIRLETIAKGVVFNTESFTAPDPVQAQANQKEQQDGKATAR